MPYPDLVPDAITAELLSKMGALFASSVVDTGESVFDRAAHTTGVAATSQDLRLMGFRARTTQSIGQVRVVTGSTAAAATPTLCRFGVYQRNKTTNLHTLIASTANDIALFAAASTTYSKPFSTAFLKTAGEDYMVGILIVSGAAMPTFISPSAGVNAAYNTDFLNVFPKNTGLVAAQADLPATIAGASIVAAAPYAHALLLQ